LQDVQQAAGKLGLRLRVSHASTERDFGTVFATLAQQQAGALVIGADVFFIGRSKPLAALALRNAIVASSDRRANPSADPALRSPITGIGSRSCARRKRPRGRAAEKRDERAALNLRAHSITLSARTKIASGTVRPRALAVLRLMTNSNFVGCSTGRSAGLAPLMILST